MITPVQLGTYHNCTVYHVFAVYTYSAHFRHRSCTTLVSNIIKFHCIRAWPPMIHFGDSIQINELKKYFNSHPAFSKHNPIQQFAFGLKSEQTGSKKLIFGPDIQAIQSNFQVKVCNIFLSLHHCHPFRSRSVRSSLATIPLSASPSL